jgi:integrase/recombinase XerD
VHALLALNGLRVSEATGAGVEHLGLERGHRTLTGTRKGRQGRHRPAGAADRPGDRPGRRRAHRGPVFLARDGRRLGRPGAGRIAGAVARRAGIAQTVTPRTLRHAFITAALTARVPPRRCRPVRQQAATPRHRRPEAG